MTEGAPEKTIRLTHRLADLLRSNHIGNTTVIAIADALAADARYNMWFYDHVKRLPESEILLKLDEDESLLWDCLSAIDKFELAVTEKLDKDSHQKNLKELEAALKTFTKNTTEAMVIRR